MRQTIEVQIDINGEIHPLESQLKLPAGRALLTLIDDNKELPASKPVTSNHFDDLFGLFTATNSASLEDMDKAIRHRAVERFNDSN